MDKAIADKWVAALRSGKYQQGKSCMRNMDDRYCCLGVLTDLLIPEAWEPDHAKYRYNSDFGPHYLPAKVMQLAGIKERDGKFRDHHDRYDNYDSLANCNDSGLTFDQIADLIEYFWADL